MAYWRQRKKSFRSFWPAYVPVAQKKQEAAEKLAQLKKKDKDLAPVLNVGRKITTTFWGQSWCKNIESYRDFAYRLERGRTYVRSGYVLDLKIKEGEIQALVQGSSLYNINIKISKVCTKKWKKLVKKCSGKIDSLMEILQGKLSTNVMEIMTDRDSGLFPSPSEIKLSCSCLDWATCCKHVAAVMYGIGVRLDERPELLFLLRGVNEKDLVVDHVETLTMKKAQENKLHVIDDKDISTIFEVNFDDDDSLPQAPALDKKTPAKKIPHKTSKKNSSGKSTSSPKPKRKSGMTKQS